MLAWLGIFLIASISMPALRHIPRNGAFIIASVVSAAAAIWLDTLAPTVIAGGVYEQRVPWIPQLDINLSFRIDALSWIFAMIVTVIGALVLAYCASYFSTDEPGRGRFAAVLLGFAGVMLGLVTADNIYLMFVFWEATSVLSFLLIGHYTGRRAARGSAMQALLVTTFGGLAMLVGVVMVHWAAGTASLQQIVAAGLPDSPFVRTAAVLVLVGAASKSALVPFHFWLPGAMAAPTPVSAYLHAASMVKAGIYLVLRLLPSFGEITGFRETLIVIGVFTMLVGGWRSLRQFDLKLILAYGTVSQLGFMMTIAGFGTRDAALAAVAMVIAHALFKAALFLVVGTIDHRAGTRDARKLSGIGRAMPVLTTFAVIAAASMAGLPPLWGFVAKEAAFGAFFDAISTGDTWGLVALVGTATGSIFTVAYTLRFLYGAFARKPDPELAETKLAPASAIDGVVIGTLVATTVVLPLAAVQWIDRLIAVYADSVPALDSWDLAHLALWHGWKPALAVSAFTLLFGVMMFAGRGTVARIQALVPAWVDGSKTYWLVMRLVDRGAARVTAMIQRGSLPVYLAWIFGVSVLSIVISAARVDFAELDLTLRTPWWSVVVLVIILIASFATAVSTKRFQSMVLVGVTGYAMAAVFALSGAPDLATTQALIETISMVVFVLVLRRLPALHSNLGSNLPSWVRWAIGAAVGLGMGLVAIIALGSRAFPSDGLALPELAVKGGHGDNFVNVTLVDIRGWDTMGELLVLVAAATGIASLIYLDARRSRRERELARTRLTPKQRRLEAERQRAGWLLAGHTIGPDQRSIVVEIVVRVIFHALLIASLFLLFSGHNDPGGGFAGGVVAGLALVARYLAGGREELDYTVRIDAGRLLGIGIVTVAITVITPIFFGYPPLTSFWIDEQIPVIGHFVLVTSTFFDIGVYLVVIGLVLDILRSLGSELDAQAEDENLAATNLGATVLDEGELPGAEPVADEPITRRIQMVRIGGPRKRKRGAR